MTQAEIAANDAAEIATLGGGICVALGVITILASVLRLRSVQKQGTSEEDPEVRKRVAGYGIAIGWGVAGILGGLLWLSLARGL